MKRKGLYYLNNSGSRWVVFDEDGRHVEHTWETRRHGPFTRRVVFFESFGNFAAATISYKGKRFRFFPDSILDIAEMDRMVAKEKNKTN